MTGAWLVDAVTRVSASVWVGLPERAPTPQSRPSGSPRSTTTNPTGMYRWLTPNDFSSSTVLDDRGLLYRLRLIDLSKASRWLFWQAGGLSSKSWAGASFSMIRRRICLRHRPLRHDVKRMYGVMNRRFDRCAYLVGDCLIVDKACVTRARFWQRMGRASSIPIS